MSGEPKTLTPQAMTLEEGLAAIFPDTIGKRNDGKWPFFTYVDDDHGHTCTAIFDSWPEAVSWAKGVRVVARDEAAELRAWVREWAECRDIETRFTTDRAGEVLHNLRRLAGGESEKS